MRRVAACLGLSLAWASCCAQNLGNYGQVFSVREVDIRQIIMNRLNHMTETGELERRQREIDARVSDHIIRPTPSVVSTTMKPKRFFVDPTVRVNQDMYTPDGVLVAKRGMRLNPFSHVTFSKTLFFFNADDAWQVAWVQKHYKEYKQVKFILTGGDIRIAAERFGRIYFDLSGRLSTLLHIEHVPSVVSQDGLRWNIQEIGEHDA